MKKLIMLFLAVWLMSSSVYATGFQPLNSGTTNVLRVIYFLDANTGYAVGGFGTIRKTTNAGLNWLALSSGTTEGLEEIYFLDANTGYIVGSSGIMLKTTNAGANWVISYPSIQNLFSVYWLNAQTGWVTGAMSTCLRTTTSGSSWSMQNIPISAANLNTIVFNDSKGFIGTSDLPNIVTTTNQGLNWLASPVRQGAISTENLCFKGSLGIAVGSEYISSLFRPLIFTTVNNGVNWFEPVLPTRKAILYAVGICPTNTNICYAVGEYLNDPTYGNKGLIFSSTNAGQSWLEEAWLSDADFWGVYITSDAVYIVGSGGLILKSALPIGINQIGTEVPDKYNLSQNYPNPFNPITNIEFAVPKNGAVKLTVFDMLGKEITTLVNQQLTVGKYKVDFDASNLSSGTYLYRLQAADYLSVKKMVLIK